MKTFRADLHVHSVLSPCGDLEMSPVRIVEKALTEKLDVIAITDHNTTRQCREIMELGLEHGLWVICGAEVNTREEVHCIALFETINQAEIFQAYLDKYLPDIENMPDIFGYQVWVNRNEEILGEESKLLWSALAQSIEEVVAEVVALEGIVFPAHVDRQVNGILRQLGFIPAGLKIDAVEVCFKKSLELKELKDVARQHCVIANSDAHVLEQVGQRVTLLTMESLDFNELRKALNRQDGRSACPCFKT